MLFRFFLPICCFSLTLLCQDGGRNTVTAGVGGGFPTGGEQAYLTSNLPSGAAFSASYEFRILKYLAPEVGVVNSIPLIPSYDPHHPGSSRERVTLVSFGLRGIAPLNHGRIELFAGLSAAHVSSSYYELSDYGIGSWLGQINGGGRIAIDKRRHFWIGPTARFSRDGGRPVQEWVSLTGDFGFRF
jgi:hypothetical protein